MDATTERLLSGRNLHGGFFSATEVQFLCETFSLTGNPTLLELLRLLDAKCWVLIEKAYRSDSYFYTSVFHALRGKGRNTPCYTIKQKLVLHYGVSTSDFPCVHEHIGHFQHSLLQRYKNGGDKIVTPLVLFVDAKAVMAVHGYITEHGLAPGTQPEKLIARDVLGIPRAELHQYATTFMKHSGGVTENIRKVLLQQEFTSDDGTFLA